MALGVAELILGVLFLTACFVEFRRYTRTRQRSSAIWTLLHLLGALLCFWLAAGDLLS